MLLLAPIVFVGVVGNHHDAVEHQLGRRSTRTGSPRWRSRIAEKSRDLEAHRGEQEGRQEPARRRRDRRPARRAPGRDAHVPRRHLRRRGQPDHRPRVADRCERADEGQHPGVRDEHRRHRGSGPPAAARAKRKAAKVDDAPLSSSHVDDDAPPGFAGGKKSEPVAGAAADDDDSTAAAPAVVEHAPRARTSGRRVHVRIGLTAGIAGRNLALDPNTVLKYYVDAGSARAASRVRSASASARGSRARSSTRS